MEVIPWLLGAMLIGLVLLFSGAASVALRHPDAKRRADALRVMDRVTALIRALLMRR